jgi:hypothetical protein
MDFKEGLIHIGGTLMIVLSIIASIFILVGFSTSETNWTFIAIGIVLFLPFALHSVYQVFASSKKENRLNDQFEKYIAEFKHTADRIKIDLDDAKIKEQQYYHKKTILTGEAAAINELTGFGEHNEETIKHTSCEVTFTINHHKKKRTLKTTIAKDETSLRMHFYMQKETFAYIHPFDPKEYYIDLEFLENI